MKSIFLPLFLAPCFFATAAPGAGSYLRLQDKLDRPQDGYCLDVAGSGPYARLDMPLTVHNCKGPELYDDEVVEFRKDGTLYFPAYQGCVTVMGNNQTALPGNALMLKSCGDTSPFLNGPRFQHYTMNEKKQIQLNQSDLCLVAGQVSSTTHSEDHRWRNLSVAPCETAALSHSQWEIYSARSHQ